MMPLSFWNGACNILTWRRVVILFHDREEAGMRLASELRGFPLTDPLILGIPRGGVMVAAVVARELDAELDVVLSRKLRAPEQEELAIGALAEDGTLFVDPHARKVPGFSSKYLASEASLQRREIERRRALIRKIRSPASVAGRCVVVTDDGIATGATVKAACEVLRVQGAKEIIIAVPVMPAQAVSELREYCHALIYVAAVPDFGSVGEFYREFRQIEDSEVLEKLKVALEEKKPRILSHPGP